MARIDRVLAGPRRSDAQGDRGVQRTDARTNLHGTHHVSAVTLSHQIKQLKMAGLVEIVLKASSPASYSNAMYSAFTSDHLAVIDHLHLVRFKML